MKVSVSLVLNDTLSRFISIAEHFCDIASFTGRHNSVYVYFGVRWNRNMHLLENFRSLS